MQNKWGRACGQHKAWNWAHIRVGVTMKEDFESTAIDEIENDAEVVGAIRDSIHRNNVGVREAGQNGPPC